MILRKISIFILTLILFSCGSKEPIIIDETGNTEAIEQTIVIDSVWSGHPVDFCLYTHQDQQYIAYYNANRNMVVGQRNLKNEGFKLYTMPATYHETSKGTSTVLGWDSHNSVTIGVDKDGYIHLAGNMHVNPLTYFKSTKPNDITTLVQQFKQTGSNEKSCTYPNFMITKEGELLFHYRDGGSGNGNEIYNIYSCETKSWSRMLDGPLTDGKGLMNAYQTQPTVLEDGRYHVYWVWRDTPDCSTNHDLSYMRSSDLKQWFNAFGEMIELPATIDQKALVVDPIPVNGGIINLAAELCLDDDRNPAFVYHKYDAEGNLQLYSAHIADDQWIYTQLTDWDYRWEFSGMGSIDFEVRLKDFNKRTDGYYEISYWHKKYGDGTILLNNKFENIGTILKAKSFESTINVEGDFSGLMVQTRSDIGNINDKSIRYILKWESLGWNRDEPRPKPWPKASQLVLYKLKKEEN